MLSPYRPVMMDMSYTIERMTDIRMGLEVALEAMQAVTACETRSKQLEGGWLVEVIEVIEGRWCSRVGWVSRWGVWGECQGVAVVVLMVIVAVVVVLSGWTGGWVGGWGCRDGVVVVVVVVMVGVVLVVVVVVVVVCVCVGGWVAGWWVGGGGGAGGLPLRSPMCSLGAMQATLSFMVEYDAFAMLDRKNMDWHLQLYQLASRDMPIASEDFRPACQHAFPMPFPEHKVWPPPHGRGGGGGGGRKGPRSARGGSRGGMESSGSHGGGHNDEGPVATDSIPFEIGAGDEGASGEGYGPDDGEEDEGIDDELSMYPEMSLAPGDVLALNKKPSHKCMDRFLFSLSRKRESVPIASNSQSPMLHRQTSRTSRLSQWRAQDLLTMQLRWQVFSRQKV
jgi:hypothetical protein